MTRSSRSFHHATTRLLRPATGMTVSLLLCLFTAGLVALTAHTVRDLVFGGMLASGFLTTFGAFLTLYLSDLHSRSLKALDLRLTRVERRRNTELIPNESAALHHAMRQATLHHDSPMVWEIPAPTPAHSDSVAPHC